MTKKARNDIILIAAVVLIAAIALGVLILTNNRGRVAVVYVDGKLYGKYPLAQERTVRITSKNGENLLVIKGGKADITEASCPDLVCVKQHPAENEIDQIICLPNKVVVAIE